jgi:hypothetical protein
MMRRGRHDLVRWRIWIEGAQVNLGKRKERMRVQPKHKPTEKKTKAKTKTNKQKANKRSRNKQSQR